MVGGRRRAFLDELVENVAEALDGLELWVAGGLECCVCRNVGEGVGKGMGHLCGLVFW